MADKEKRERKPSQDLGRPIYVTRAEGFWTTFFMPLSLMATNGLNQLAVGLSLERNVADKIGAESTNNVDAMVEATQAIHKDEALSSITRSIVLSFEQHPVVSTLAIFTGLTLYLERLGVVSHENDSLLKAESVSTKAFIFRYMLQHQGLITLASCLNASISNGEFNMPSGVELAIIVAGGISTLQSIIGSYDFLKKLTGKSRLKRAQKLSQNSKLKLKKLRETNYKYFKNPAAELLQKELADQDDKLAEKVRKLEDEIKSMFDGAELDNDNAIGAKYPLHDMAEARKPFPSKASLSSMLINRMMTLRKMSSDDKNSDSIQIGHSIPPGVSFSLTRIIWRRNKKEEARKELLKRLPQKNPPKD